MSLSQQVPINGTYQKRILPGGQTNLYYILLSNLPWQTSWQQLKDHVRSVCPVERVEVFNESTTGWVSVKGRDNFNAAFGEDTRVPRTFAAWLLTDHTSELLNGGIFNGRALFADGKNATNSVMIKEPVVVANTPKQATSGSKHVRRTSPPTTRRGDIIPTVAPPARPVYDQWLYNVLPPISDFQAHPSIYYATSGCRTDSTLPHIPDGREFKTRPNQSALPPRPVDYVSGPCYYPVRPWKPIAHPEGRLLGYDEHMQVAQPGIMKNSGHEGFRVIIRHIAPHVTYGDFQGVLQHKIGHDTDSIVRLDLPVSEDYDSNIGYAVATFCSEGAASRAVRKFQGLRFENRVLKAELATTPSPRDESKHRRPARPRKSTQAEEKEVAHSGSHNESSKKSRGLQKGSVVIANGSSSTRTPRQKL